METPDEGLDALASKFDAVVVGTGVLESILACSLARAGKKVLHLDSNEYYGHGSTSAPFKEFFKKCAGEWESPSHSGEGGDGEREKSKHFRDPNVYSNLVAHESAARDDIECVSSLSLYGNKKAEKIHPSCYGYVMDKCAEVESPSGSGGADCRAHPVFEGYRKDHYLTANRANFHSRHFCIETTHKLVLATGAAVDTIISSDVGRYLDFKALDSVFYIHRKQKAGSSSGGDGGEIIVDKVPASKGDIFSSSTLQALEKRCLMKVLQHTIDRGQRKEGHKGGATTLNERDLSMGRALRRPQNTPESVTSDGGEDETFFADYLGKNKVSPRLQEIIAHGLCLYKEPILDSQKIGAITTGEALDTLYRHVDSIGRYGTTPFITCMYGSAEIAQAFCRMCAVWGGIYILGRGISQVRCTNVEAGDDHSGGKAVSAVVDSEGREIQCAALVCNVDYLPVNMPGTMHSPSDSGVATAVVVTRVSVISATLLTGGLSVAVIPPLSLGLRNAQAVHVVQLDDSASVCPDGATLIYLTTTLPLEGESMDAMKEKAATMMETCAGLLLSTAPDAKEIGYATFATPSLDIDAAKKKYTEECLNNGTDDTAWPSNLYLTDEKGGDLHLDEAFRRAKEIFAEICPDAVFMESVPVENGAITEEEEEEELLRSMLESTATTTPETSAPDVPEERNEKEDSNNVTI